MADRSKPRRGAESGEVMLEGMIVMVITMFMLIWILALGFIYYQRFCTTVITNDAAEKISATYDYTSTDIITGYIKPTDITFRKLYRNIGQGGNRALVHAVNEARAAAYIKYRLDKVNFVGVIDNVDVELKNVSDSSVRKHIELSVICSYRTPLGEIFSMFGMERNFSYKVVAYAERTDYTDAYATVDFGASFTDGRIVSGTGFLSSLLGAFNSLVKMIDQFTS